MSEVTSIGKAAAAELENYVPGAESDATQEPPPLQEEHLESFYPDPVGETARNVFGVPSLYPWQRLVIANILECSARLAGNAPSQDAADSDDDTQNRGRQVVLLPTGAGKSMCFMVPAMMMDRPTLIIYPLLALMSDQLRRIEKAGIQAVLFRGQQTRDEREENFRRLRGGAKIILANPEVLQSEALLERLAEFNIMHAAIDEAHCVSEWGDTFRPSYLALGDILRRLNIPVVTAFTATASPPVLSRMTEVLFGGERPYLMRSTADRQNIHYSVTYTCAKEKTALKLAMTEKRPMIIFCGTRALSEKTARLLREVLPRDEVRFYHAGLTKEEKTATEQWFFPHKNAVLCCTCAFGMGIDKSDIRTVVHLEPSPTAEAYIQEAGRGGRDGSPTKAILLWSLEDSIKAKQLPSGGREKVLSQFAESSTCRRQVLLDALGAEEAVCSGCDICDASELKLKVTHHAEDARLTYNYLRIHSGRWTKKQAAERLCHKANSLCDLRIYEPQDFIGIIEQMCKYGVLYTRGWKEKRLYLKRFSGSHSSIGSVSSAGGVAAGAGTRFF